MFTASTMYLILAAVGGYFVKHLGLLDSFFGTGAGAKAAAVVSDAEALAGEGAQLASGNLAVALPQLLATLNKSLTDLEQIAGAISQMHGKLQHILPPPSVPSVAGK